MKKGIVLIIVILITLVFIVKGSFALAPLVPVGGRLPISLPQLPPSFNMPGLPTGVTHLHVPSILAEGLASLRIIGALSELEVGTTVPELPKLPPVVSIGDGAIMFVALDRSYSQDVLDGISERLPGIVEDIADLIQQAVAQGRTSEIVDAVNSIQAYEDARSRLAGHRSDSHSPTGDSQIALANTLHNAHVAMKSSLENLE